MRPVVAMLGAVAFAGATAVLTRPAAAQEEAPLPPPLEIGATAPDFALSGGTRYGVLEQRVRLSDYRGEVVVLAFFFRARSRG